MSCGLPVPGPAEAFTVWSVTTQELGVWSHVDNTATYPTTTALMFAEGWGDTRFAPIDQADGTPVHTYCVASSRESVYRESVLHGVALAPPGTYEVASLRHYHVVKLQMAPAVAFVSFHSLDLPKLNLSRAQLVNSLTDCYPQTRAWSQAVLQRTDAQAIGYDSSRNDSGRCLMLFKQRLLDPPFMLIEEQSLLAPALRAEVLAWVRSLGVREV